MKLSNKQIQEMISYGKTLAGKPYERGSSTQNTAVFDCSSLMQHIFKKVKIDLPRSSILQAAEPQGILLIPTKNKPITYKRGDVLFMESDRGFYFDEIFGNKHLCIGHVGLYIGNNKILHARKSAGGVVIESLSQLQKDSHYKTVAVRRYTHDRPIYKVPTRSQYLHIHHREWKDRSCGIVSVGMVLLFYKKIVTMDELLKQGLRAGAYKEPYGWTHAGLVSLAQKYKLHAAAYDWSKDIADEAFLKLVSFLEEGPVLASIHKDFDQKNGGHLIVITGFKDGIIYYNEPASKKGESIKRKISKEIFLEGWKKRMLAIYIHP